MEDVEKQRIYLAKSSFNIFSESKSLVRRGRTLNTLLRRKTHVVHLSSRCGMDTLVLELEQLSSPTIFTSLDPLCPHGKRSRFGILHSLGYMGTAVSRGVPQWYDCQ